MGSRKAAEKSDSQQAEGEEEKRRGLRGGDGICGDRAGEAGANNRGVALRILAIGFDGVNGIGDAGAGERIGEDQLEKREAGIVGGKRRRAKTEQGAAGKIRGSERGVEGAGQEQTGGRRDVDGGISVGGGVVAEGAGDGATVAEIDASEGPGDAVGPGV